MNTPDDQKTRDENQRDYNAEIAGLPIGRIMRFLSPNAAEQRLQGKEQKSEKQMSLLELLLLTDPRYAELYADTVEVIEDIDHAIAKTLKDFDRNLHVLERHLTDIRGNANELSDGTRIYRSADGTIYTENEDILSEEESRTIEWKDHHPSWEDYTHARDQVERTRQNIAEVENYRDTVLQDTKDKVYDRNNPLDFEELETVREHLLDSVPTSVQNNMTHSGHGYSKSEFAQQFSLKVSGIESTDSTKDNALPPTEEPAQNAEGSSFLSNFSQKL